MTSVQSDLRSRFATAPGTWGVEPIDGPEYPTWSSVLDEIAEAGFAGTELGPFGYYPTDPSELTRALGDRGLRLPAGFVMLPLSRPEARTQVLREVARVCSLVGSVQGSVLVLIDALCAERTATAGCSDLSRRLDATEWDELTNTIAMSIDAAKANDLSVAFHPHAGTFVEFQDEIDRLLAEPALRELGVCLDTGHLAYAGIDPVAAVERFGARLIHVHMKDLDRALLGGCLDRSLGFEESVAAGVFTALGQGDVDLAGVLRALMRQSYTGWATYEQDRTLDTLRQALPDARTSLRHLLTLMERL